MRANLAAIRTTAQITEQQRSATAAEQRVLARWSGWGAVPQVFDDSRPEFEPVREQLRGLLTDPGYTAARRTTINAHYTDPAYPRAMWQLLEGLGFTQGRVLEPGCGAGTFIGLAPPGAALTGVELDPTTARVAALLYPGATIRAESFADTHLPAGVFDAVIGNVGFAEVWLHDPVGNPGGHALHNHFIIKSLQLTRPGGLVVVLTSSFTLVAVNPAARREMHQLAELLDAVRLPTGAHRRAAGTDVVTDLLVLRRRPAGTAPGPDGWTRTRDVDVAGRTVRINAHLADHPDRILGELGVGHGLYGQDTLQVTGGSDPTELVGRLGRVLGEITDRATSSGLTPSPAPPRDRPRRRRFRHRSGRSRTSSRPGTSPPTRVGGSPSAPPTVGRTS